ncbi:heavy metal-associated isoprenylated plant protein 39-like [Prosopis cineraria]|uniref:heavy metal-associated isoprenylated plant protein 39-like n=1 Tax=Prosopis cineraria TaxID=364024 RepID=UPI00240EB777|nr:heavy metal-associated isoprenylated plant protein 39-like [Prosopis cineraria]
MKKIVLKVDFHAERIKQKATKTTSGISGVESVNVDTKDKKLTVMGDIDPVNVVGKLRKLCRTEIVSVGPAKESDKKAERR